MREARKRSDAVIVCSSRMPHEELDGRTPHAVLESGGETAPVAALAAEVAARWA